MIINKYDTNCSVCSAELSAGRGFAFKNDMEKWKSVCTGFQCVKQACPDEISEYHRLMEIKLQKVLTIDGVLHYPYDETSLKLIRAMPGAHYEHAIEAWKVSTKSEDRKRVIEIAKKLKVEIHLSEDRSEHIKKLLEYAKEKGAYDYQLEGIDWLAGQSNCLLADQQGLGKSLMALMAIDKDLGHLIICPSHLKLNWRDEINNWRSDLKPIIIKSKKDFKYPKPCEIMITSYGSLPDRFLLPDGKRKIILEEQEHEEAKNMVVIYDEVQALKNNKTKQSKKAKQLTKISKRAIGLTGTPIMSKQIELWNIFVALDIEKRVFGSWPNFLKLFNGRKGFYGFTFGEPREELPEVLRIALLRRVQNEVGIQLPSEIYTEISVEADNKTKRILDSAWELYKRSDYFEHGELPDITEMSKIKKELAESKIPALKEIVNDLEEKGICPIVFSAHRAPVLEMGQRKGWACIHGGMTPEEKHKIKDQFQAGKLKGLAATIKACGTGLTLTYAHHVVFNDLDWVPANNNQAEFRVKRIGQKEDRVFYYYLVTDHPIDQRIHKLLLEKMRLTRDTLEGRIEIKEVETGINETVEEFENRKKEIEEKDHKLGKSVVEDLLELWCKQNEIRSGKSSQSIEQIKKMYHDTTFKYENDERIAKLVMYGGFDKPESFLLLEELIKRQN